MEEKSIKLSNGEYFGAVNSKGLPHGFGMINYDNGDQFSGDFVDGLPHGDGVYRWADGRSEYATFVHGKTQGTTSYWVDGKEYNRRYVDGKLVQ